LDWEKGKGERVKGGKEEKGKVKDSPLPLDPFPVSLALGLIDSLDKRRGR
jgi:hypothetical protein